MTITTDPPDIDDDEISGDPIPTPDDPILEDLKSGSSDLFVGTAIWVCPRCGICCDWRGVCVCGNLMSAA